MRRSGHTLLLLTGLALVAASCGGDTAETTPTTLAPADTTTTTGVVVTTTPPTTTLPGGPPLITEGDSNETVAAFQWLLDCAGYASLTVDGNFGSATSTALQTALTTLGRSVPDDDAFADLSRLCTEVRPLLADDEITVVGNASPDDPERFLLPLIFDSSLTITITPSDGALVTVQSADGTPVVPGPATGTTTTTTTTVPATTTTTAATTTTLAPTTTTTIPGGLPTMTWAIGATGDYTIVVTSDFEPVTFSLKIEIGDDAEGIADWLITTTGITYKDNPKLEIGDNGEDIIDKIFEYLGHGVRGGAEFDTGWTPDGFRGIAIEGFRFLFYGPSPGELARVRIFAPGNDAAGNPRPASYAMTPQGIGPGMTRAQLLEVYPGLASGETDDGDHYYRLTNPGGELCFYFGEDAVTDTSVILEISTECRS